MGGYVYLVRCWVTLHVESHSKLHVSVIYSCVQVHVTHTTTFCEVCGLCLCLCVSVSLVCMSACLDMSGHTCVIVGVCIIKLWVSLYLSCWCIVDPA